MSNSELAILVINLDSSQDRLRAFHDAFDGISIPILRIPGVKGSQIPKAAAMRLASQRIGLTQWAGALGATLGHIAALEQVLASGVQNCLILEDDARPTATMFRDVGSLMLPPNYDICFVNNRLNPNKTNSNDAEIQFMGLPDSLCALPKDLKAPGADGYIVSASGARKLLEWFAVDGFGHFFDWRLIGYSTTPEQCENLDKESPARALLTPLHKSIPRADRLAGFIMSPSLIYHPGITSDLIREGKISADK